MSLGKLAVWWIVLLACHIWRRVFMNLLNQSLLLSRFLGMIVKGQLGPAVLQCSATSFFVLYQKRIAHLPCVKLNICPLLFTTNLNQSFIRNRHYKKSFSGWQVVAVHLNRHTQNLFLSNILTHHHPIFPLIFYCSYLLSTFEDSLIRTIPKRQTFMQIAWEKERKNATSTLLLFNLNFSSYQKQY